MNNCGFLLQHYEDTLKLALKKGYKFMTIEEFGQATDKKQVPEKLIVLRHDIDFDLNLSVRLATIEHKHSIKSTYFIRIHAKYYSPFSVENYTTLMMLMGLDHEIGLHFDSGFAQLFNEKYEERLLRDKIAFENLLGRNFNSISVHEPARTGTTLNELQLENVGLKYNAYSDTFLKHMKYISDSGGRWREGCMCEFIRKGTARLYILTHPFWWYQRSPAENY